MELIDRYVAEVGRSLPEKMRSDLEKEIRSLLLDTLEDRSQALGRPADETLAVEVLQEFGSPEKVAASYLPPSYLIGPRLFPIFWLVVRIVLAALGVAFTVLMALSLARTGWDAGSFARALWQAVTSYLTAAMQGFGSTVLVFAILQRVIPEAEFDKEDKPWDPRSLPPVKDPQRISIAGVAVEMAFTLLVIGLCTFYSDRLGMYSFQSGAREWTFTPVFSPAFFAYLPWWVGLWAVKVILQALLLRQGRWTTALRGFSTLISLATLGLLFVMANGPSLVLPDALSALGEAGSKLTELAGWGVRLFIGLLFGIEAINMVQVAWPLVKKPAAA